MLTIELFIVFLFVYAWFFVPSKRVTAPVVVNDVLEVEATPIEIPAATAAMVMAEAELVISVEELEELMPVEVPQVSEVPNYAAMGVVELRKACSDRGLQWRRYSRQGGKKKATAISRDEMIALLMA